MSSEDRIKRGKEADRLRDNPLLTEAFVEVDQQLMKDWRATKPDETKERELIFAKLQVLEEVKQAINAFIHDGTLASRKANIL